MHHRLIRSVAMLRRDRGTIGVIVHSVFPMEEILWITSELTFAARGCTMPNVSQKHGKAGVTQLAEERKIGTLILNNKNI